MTLESGEYENFYSGTLLRDLHARVDADAGRVVLSEFGATDGADGRIRADGSLALDRARDFPFTVKARIEKAKLVRRDDLDASGSGDMTVSGTLSDILIAGRLSTETVNWYLPSQLPPEVVDLPVVTTGGPAGAAAPAPAEAGPAIRLDLEIDLPKRVFVRGRGLDSEWSGRLHLTGPADKPAIEGKIGVVRGRFQFVGKTFDLTSGSVTFPGGLGAEPMLDIEAQHSETGLTVTARITGRVSKVSIALSSQPAYPQDEILSRLLFGKGLNKISAVEAVQVASAVSQLSGAGPGAGDLLSLARNFLGVDVLRLETPAGGGAAGTRLEAGKYVRRDVYLGVAQGTSPGSAQVNVDVEVTPNISVESGVGQQGTSNVGIKFKWDY
jgi:translocation and assembly module TamB